MIITEQDWKKAFAEKLEAGDVRYKLDQGKGSYQFIVVGPDGELQIYDDTIRGDGPIVLPPDAALVLYHFLRAQYRRTTRHDVG